MKAAKKIVTQADADAEMTRCIDRAIRFEERRDAAEYESAEYWRLHSEAIRWHYKAEQSMPVSARTIELKHFS